MWCSCRVHIILLSVKLVKGSWERMSSSLRREAAGFRLLLSKYSISLQISILLLYLWILGIFKPHSPLNVNSSIWLIRSALNYSLGAGNQLAFREGEVNFFFFL